MKTSKMGRTIAEKQATRRDILRRVLSIVLLLLSAVPMLGGGVCAMWVIPVIVCICMYEQPYFCMAAGIIGGIAIDLATGAALGTNAIYLVIFATAASMLFSHLLAKSFLHYLPVTALCALLHGGLRYGIQAWLLRRPDCDVLWSAVLWPSFQKTILVAVLIYLLYLPIARLLTKRVQSMDAAAVQRPTP